MPKIHASLLVLVLVLALVLVLGCTAHHPTRTATPATAAAPRTVVLVRHAEKATDGSDDPGLTEAGERRAKCLARTMRDAGVTHVFATTLQRTQQTVAPLAEGLGLQVEVFAPDDDAGLLAALDRMPAGAVAVVAGHANTLPTIATRLGAPLSGLDADGDLPVYDRLDVVVRARPDHGTHLQLRYCEPDPG